MAMIDHDGVFRLYKHLRDNKGDGSCPSSWTIVQGIPDDICGALASDHVNGVNQIFHCLAATRDGKKRNKELVDFVKLKNVDFPFTSYKLVEGPQVNEASCKQLCLDYCLCVVAIYEEKGNLCWKKNYPPSNGRQSQNITRITLIKVPKDHGSDKKDQSVVVILALLLGSSVFLNILFFLISYVAVYYLYNKKMKLAWNIDRTLATNVRNNIYKELEEATRGFKQILGRGALATVYKGVLASDSKRFVAIKKLDKLVEEVTTIMISVGNPISKGSVPKKPTPP
ncbi:G-type lectin S-receptor-like serine/threonine-protein kinase LECRK3 [Castanea sativa]|uniref:G-type lectin S-receptor-like serine/threonine-protein kinase LECRK3 n=1 Tax=Castanea sativa TaxID=21020 RepID=UPI003F649858